jgi:hypothetical protein
VHRRMTRGPAGRRAPDPRPHVPATITHSRRPGMRVAVGGCGSLRRVRALSSPTAGSER